MKKLIFIIGTGRSGTHLIGRTIASHPDVEGHIEDPEHFVLSSYIAAYQDVLPSFLVYPFKMLLVRRYKKLLKNTSAEYILEKSHTNIWLAEFLHKEIPNAVFVGVLRDVLPTVSSMLEHKHVMSWYKKLPQNRVNRFLGITKENVEGFKGLSNVEKCVLRWQSHKRELARLENILPPERLKVINYESFMNTPEDHLQELANFIKIDNRYQFEKLKLESLDKWKNTLTVSQIRNIRGLVSNDA